MAYDSGSVSDIANRLRGFSRCFVRARMARSPDEVFSWQRSMFAEFVPWILALALFSFAPIRPWLKARGGSSVVALLDAGVCCRGAVRRLCLGELPVTPRSARTFGQRTRAL